MSTTPAAGEPAPDFALPDETGAVHRLSDQRGWTVVYFYPKDDTPGCTVEACDFRDLGDALVAGGATVWGISPDGAASHRRFRTKFQLTFPAIVAGPASRSGSQSLAHGNWLGQ